MWDRCGTRAGSFFNLNAGVLVWFQCALDVSKDKQGLKLETVCRFFVPLCQETLAAKLQTSQLYLARATLSSRFKVKIISLALSETPWRRIAVKMPVALLPARRHCLARVECQVECGAQITTKVLKYFNLNCWQSGSIKLSSSAIPFFLETYFVLSYTPD